MADLILRHGSYDKIWPIIGRLVWGYYDIIKSGIMWSILKAYIYLNIKYGLINLNFVQNVHKNKMMNAYGIDQFECSLIYDEIDL